MGMIKDEERSNNLDYGDYTNNKIEFAYELNCGIYFKARDNIKAGELLLAKKSFSSIKYDKNDELPLDSKTLFDLKKSEMIDKLTNRSDEYKEFYLICDGRNIDENLETRMKTDNKPSLDKIKRVVDANGFVTLRPYKLDFTTVAMGLWMFPSFVNHSCVPNTFYNGIGDFIFIRATKFISKGEEITVSYLDANLKNYFMRKNKIESNWKFTCRCELCKLEEIEYRYEETIFITNEIERLRDFKNYQSDSNLIEFVEKNINVN